MDRWLPTQLVALAREVPEKAFTQLYNCPFYLAVAVDSATSELALGLQDDARVAADGIGFSTVAARGKREDSATALQAALPSSSANEPHADTTRLTRMLDMCCYVVPLQKKAAASFLHSVTVGRARNHDLVLRHQSVSKFHATLEIEDGELFLKDVGSTNLTFLNQHRVTGRHRVHEGDVLRFGAVEVLVCTNVMLWRAATSRDAE